MSDFFITIGILTSFTAVMVLIGLTFSAVSNFVRDVKLMRQQVDWLRDDAPDLMRLMRRIAALEKAIAVSKEPTE